MIGSVEGETPASGHGNRARRCKFQTTRAALNLKPNDQMRAHRLIPANVWEQQLGLATLASQAGWRPDSSVNLIALPANEATRAKLAAEDGFLLPIHDSSHSKYDGTCWGEIVIEEEKYRGAPTPAASRRANGTLCERLFAAGWFERSLAGGARVAGIAIAESPRSEKRNLSPNNNLELSGRPSAGGVHARGERRAGRTAAHKRRI